LATVLVTGPVAGVSALAGPSDPRAVEVRADLDRGVNENCGPPYVLSP